jgi:hypothetical protein
MARILLKNLSVELLRPAGVTGLMNLHGSSELFGK